ncbi:unnamed protein product [Arabidopsis thaliana]|uniref:Transmembrane protein n=1 Tax=Arabidopsis thaliana TaxID=3702 RepID=Q9LJ96_ARATH|nr:unnamed protein product [Arabidopsis thaliana]
MLLHERRLGVGRENRQRRTPTCATHKGRDRRVCEEAIYPRHWTRRRKIVQNLKLSITIRIRKQDDNKEEGNKKEGNAQGVPVKTLFSFGFLFYCCICICGFFWLKLRYF